MKITTLEDLRRRQNRIEWPAIYRYNFWTGETIELYFVEIAKNGQVIVSDTQARGNTWTWSPSEFLNSGFSFEKPWLMPKLYWIRVVAVNIVGAVLLLLIFMGLVALAGWAWRLIP